MKMFKTVLMTMLLFAGSAQADEWDFGVGVSYVTGISDVVDLYEDNYEAENPGDVDVVTIPIGVSFVGRYQADSGMMFHVGVGPAFIIVGDADHTEIPFSATIGYAFSPKGDSSAYARIGCPIPDGSALDQIAELAEIVGGIDLEQAELVRRLQLHCEAARAAIESGAGR